MGKVVPCCDLTHTRLSTGASLLHWQLFFSDSSAKKRHPTLSSCINVFAVRLAAPEDFN